MILIGDKKFALKATSPGKFNLDVSGSAETQLAQYTIEMWFKLTAPPGESHCLFGLYQQAVANSVNLTIANGGFNYLRRIAQGGSTQDEITKFALPDPQFTLNKWHHLALVFDTKQKAAPVRIYANGLLVGSVDDSRIVNASYAVTLGLQPQITAMVAFWREAKTDRVTGSDRFRIPTMKPAETNLLRCWTFEQSGDEPIKDQAGTKTADLPAGARWISVSDFRSPATGGHREALLSKITQYNLQQIAQAKDAQHDAKQEAHNKALADVTKAHQQATTLINSSKFDNIYYLYGGQLRSVTAKGDVRQLTFADPPTPGTKWALMKSGFEFARLASEDRAENTYDFRKGLTVGAWFKPYAERFINISGGTYWWVVNLDRNPNYARLLRNASQTWDKRLEGECEFTFNAWVHIAFSFGSDAIRLYLNGKEIAADLNHPFPLNDLAACGPVFAFVKGEIARVVMWSAEKSQYEIAQSMVNDPDPNDLVHFWNFNNPDNRGVYWSTYRYAAPADLENKFGGEVRFIQYSSDKLNDLYIDLIQKRLYTCSDGQRIDVWNLDGAPDRTLYQRNAPIHTLAVDTTDNRLYWIEGDGALYRGDLAGAAAVQLENQLSPGSMGQWQMTIDPKGRRLYWTQGREIWVGTIQKDQNNLGRKQIFIPNAESPAPIDLDFDNNSGALCWIDRQLQQVRRATSGSDIQTLYAAPNVRRGLAIDDEIGQLYWNCDYTQPTTKDKPARTVTYLMRGSVKGDTPAEPVFPLAIEGGLALASKTEAAHEQRIAAYRQRQQAEIEARQKLLAAREKAAADIQQAHKNADAKHDQVQQKIAAAQTDAQQQRAAAYQRLQDNVQLAGQKVSAAKTAAQRTKDQAQQQASGIKQSALDRKKNMISDAQSDLAKAKTERAKHN